MGKEIQMIIRISNNREINYYLINSIETMCYQYRKKYVGVINHTTHYINPR